MREPAVERAHPHERERARVDPRVVEEELRRAPERAAEDAADDERRAEVAGASAASDGEARRDDLHDAEEREELDAAPSEGEPGGAGDRELRRAVSAAEDAEPLPRLPDAAGR